MAAKRRHWKEKDGRFWARIAIPKELQPLCDGKTQLTEPLGGDRRIADQKHTASVARLQERIAEARRLRHPASTKAPSTPPLQPLRQEMLAEAVWSHYSSRLEADDKTRARMPSFDDMNAEYVRLMQRIDAGEIGVGRDPMGMINGQTDYELMCSAREDDRRNRTRRLAALKAAYSLGDTRLVEPAVRDIVASQQLAVEPASAGWRALADGLCRAEIAALERTMERDSGNHGGQPMDPIVTAPEQKAGECHELCVSGLAHAGFRYGHALKRSSNMIAN